MGPQTSQQGSSGARTVHAGEWGRFGSEAVRERRREQDGPRSW
jgi:hypothetical protein